uniref:Uncharacterized protein n=1 Tax=Panagrolaimus davidi TaxID=227884 RepID=A0A914RDA3_9BILA
MRIQFLTNLRKRKRKNDIETETDNNNSENDVANYEESEDDAEQPNNEKNKRCSKKCRKYSMSNIIESPNFKIIHVIKNNRSLPKLIIFPLPQDRTKCYEYFWSNSRKAYVCCGCSLIQQKYIQAQIFKTNNGKECVRFQEGAKHVCQIREYNSEKNDSDPSKLIIESPNFKIFSYLKKGVQKKTLVIFNANKTFCYEYFWSSVKKRFECSSCSKKGKLNAAWIFEKDGKECIRITPNGKTHLCTARKFDAKRFSVNEVVINSPNYQIVTDERKGIRKEKLLIFPNEDDREHCYEYYWKETCKSFLCAFCSNRRKYLRAKIVQIDGCECAVLNSLEHVCEIQNYDSNRYKFIEPEVIDESGFVLRKFENEPMSKSILFIFDPTNKNLGYEYYWHYSQLCYYCVGCREYDKAATATVYQNPDGKEYVKPSKSGHICDLQEFDAEKMTKRNILQKADFKLHEKFRLKKIQKLLFIFSTKDHKFGYQFKCTEKPQNRYMCVKCNSKKYHVSAYLYTDKNGDDYISVQEKEHLCTPVEYNPGSYEEKRKIVEAPNFQIIQRRIKNKFLDKLIIFDSSDKSLCFEYTKKSNNQYICNSCYYPHKHHVFAKIIKTSNGIVESVELGPNEHKCKPIKFESPESLIVQLPNFKIQTTKRYGEQRKTLLICSSENPKLKYVYYYCTERHEFLCGKCKPKKRISAKLLQNENGEDYLVLNSTKHLCKPF